MHKQPDRNRIHKFRPRLISAALVAMALTSLASTATAAPTPTEAPAATVAAGALTAQVGPTVQAEVSSATGQGAPVRVAFNATTGTAAKGTTAAAAYWLPPNYVKAWNALLRSQPNTSSAKLDVAQWGQGIDLYCWVNYTDSSRYIWFKAHPWGSRYTGWMRADLIAWRTYPTPGRC